jgi:hypothetical protein
VVEREQDANRPIEVCEGDRLPSALNLCPTRAGSQAWKFDRRVADIHDREETSTRANDIRHPDKLLRGRCHLPGSQAFDRYDEPGHCSRKLPAKSDADGIDDEGSIEVLKDDPSAVSCNTHGFYKPGQIVTDK